MDPSTLQHHHQEIMASESLDSMLVCTKATQQEQGQGQGQEKKPRPPDEVLKCPRCDSTNTKFCYYNNYSLTQPRYFCKSCRRYWTKGGTLRNVPVGGGCRKNRRSSSSSSSSSSRRSTPDHLLQPHHHHHHHHLMMTSVPSSSIPSSSSPSSPNSALLLSTYDHHHHHHNHNQNHNHNHPLSTNDLSLAFARLQKQVGGFDNLENHGNISLLGNPSGNSHFDLFGSSLIEPQSNGLQHLYYGGNNVNVNTHDDHHQNYQNQHQMGLQFDHNHNHNQNNQEMMSNPSSGSSTPTTIKQELGENRVLWGLPWQLSNGQGNYMNNGAVNVIGGANINELDSLKESWSNTGVLNPTLHSLLNSPLM